MAIIQSTQHKHVRLANDARAAVTTAEGVVLTIACRRRVRIRILLVCSQFIRLEPLDREAAGALLGTHGEGCRAMRTQPHHNYIVCNFHVFN